MESGTHLKSVKITLNIFAVNIDNPYYRTLEIGFDVEFRNKSEYC